MQEDRLVHQPEDDEAGALADVFVIDDLETLKTIADPLRVQMVEQLVVEPLTVKQVAAKLGLTPARLYYHVNLLEEYGLIRVVEQRLVGNLVEKVYRATAREIDVAPSLLSFATRQGKESIKSMAISTLDVTREDLLRSLEARAYALAQGAPERPRRIMVTRQVHRIPESEAEALFHRAQELQQAFEAAAVPDGAITDGAVDDGAIDDGAAADGSAGEEVHCYAFAVALYPRFDYPTDIDTDIGADADNA